VKALYVPSQLSEPAALLAQEKHHLRHIARVQSERISGDRMRARDWKGLVSPFEPLKRSCSNLTFIINHDQDFKK
jgi:hypothetical protein